MSRIRLLTAFLLFSSLSAKAAVVEITPSGDLRAAIAALGPGDELVLAGGTYNMSSRFAITANGTVTQPIVIRQKAGQSALIQMNTGSQNVVEVEGSSHLVLRGLRFRGGSHGIRLMSSSFVTIEDCEVFDTGDVAISANSGGTYDGLVIRRNHIHDTNGTGEGMYLGCNSNTCRVMNSTIENNYIHHTNAPTVEQGDGIELKEGSANNVLRNNVIHDTNYPGIITYSTVGNGAPNVVEGNVIWNTNDNGIQSAANAIIRNNIVLGSPIRVTVEPHCRSQYGHRCVDRRSQRHRSGRGREQCRLPGKRRGDQGDWRQHEPRDRGGQRRNRGRLGRKRRVRKRQHRGRLRRRTFRRAAHRPVSESRQCANRRRLVLLRSGFGFQRNRARRRRCRGVRLCGRRKSGVADRSRIQERADDRAAEPADESHGPITQTFTVRHFTVRRARGRTSARDGKPAPRSELSRRGRLRLLRRDCVARQPEVPLATAWSNEERNTGLTGLNRRIDRAAHQHVVDVESDLVPDDRRLDRISGD
jgi:hypothetical protein